MASYSDTASAILTLLNNIDELIVISNDRQGAREVMNAITIYANNKGYPIPEQKIEDFLSILIDSRPYVLSSVIQSIASDVLNSERKQKKTS